MELIMPPRRLPGFVAGALAIAAGFYLMYETPEKANKIPHTENSTLEQIKRK